MCNMEPVLPGFRNALKVRCVRERVCVSIRSKADLCCALIGWALVSWGSPTLARNRKAIYGGADKALERWRHAWGVSSGFSCLCSISSFITHCLKFIGVIMECNILCFMPLSVRRRSRCMKTPCLCSRASIRSRRSRLRRSRPVWTVSLRVNQSRTTVYHNRLEGEHFGCLTIWDHVLR